VGAGKGLSSVAVDEKLVVEKTSLLFPEGNDITGIEDELSRHEASALG
jgi:hypothetical protein